MSRFKLIACVKFLLILSLVVVSVVLFLKSLYIYGVILSLLVLLLSLYLGSQYFKLFQYMLDFAESTKYHDFTRNYPKKREKTFENTLFKAFNRINTEFKNIHLETEVQNQYLNKVINMLDSGIVFYEADSGNVIWINEAFKELFNTPHLGNIKALQKRNPDLYDKTLAAVPGDSQIETADSSKGKIKLWLQLSEFKTKNGVFRIVYYKNINEAMDETESKAYHKLLRVLTHEIMNSIAPISSLSHSLQERLENIDSLDDLEDVKIGINTIKSRSEGLIQFSKRYRLMNKIENPQFENKLIIQLFQSINQLLEPIMVQEGIDLDVVIKNTKLQLYIDSSLIEQVLINLLLNAIEATKNHQDPKIILTVLELDNGVHIRIKDNGVGISPELQEQIFTPFFTTKKTGSGIGLALTKEVMLLHKGNVSVKSQEGQGSVFTLKFPKI